MTTEALRPRGGTAPREDSAEAAVRAFFAAYRAHDVEGMVDLCADNADFRYVPFEVWGRQRVLYGEGKVRTVGKAPLAAPRRLVLAPDRVVEPAGRGIPEEREWLHDKYPQWEERFGPIWDVIIGNINNNRMELTLPETLPWLCNLCHLPIGTAGSPRNEKFPVRSYPLNYNSHTYHFCSRPCRQIWWEDRDTLYDRTVIERLLGGEIQPPTVEGILTWMGITPDVMGDDAYGYRWAKPYARTRRPEDRPGRPYGATTTETCDPGMQAEQISQPPDDAQPVPVNAMFGSDFVTQLVVVLDTDTVEEAARKVAAQVVGRRVSPRDAGLVVRHAGTVVPGDVTVAESGISALDIVNVGWAD